MQKRSLKETVLHQNPFWLLGATVRDDRRRIVELADEKSFIIDHDACQKARSDLTNPRNRLVAEMAWLPGVSPQKAVELAGLLLHDPTLIRAKSDLPRLANANLMAAAFEWINANDAPGDIAHVIREMAKLVDHLSIIDILRDINEDRAISGFPEIKVQDQIEAELAERKRYFRNAVKDALNRLPPRSLVEAMTLAVDHATNGGQDHAPELIDELVDSYAVETQHFLQQEAENAHKLIKVIRDSAPAGENAVKPLIDKLEVVARNWDKVAQPIQLSAKARGIDHDQSSELAHSMRSLAIDLFNQYDMLIQSRRITELLRELFAELPEVADRLDQDAETLEEISSNRKEAEAQRIKWEREITYQAEIGAIFKDTLSISPNGVSWKDRHYPLDSITRIRWGGVRHSVNGVPTGTSYTLAFGDNRSESIVELKREDIYLKFTSKLLQAIGIRLLSELIDSLKSGKEIRFGDSVLRDDGITLPKHKIFGANELTRRAWHQVQTWSANGAFYIRAKDDEKIYTQLSYIDVPNAHILAHALSIAFEKPGMRKLSDAFQEK